MRKVVDALPDSHRSSASDAAERLLVDPATDLLSRRQASEVIPEPIMVEVRHAVLAGHQLRIRYAAQNREPSWRTVDPIGLVTVRDKGYLLATHSGADRTYRLSRILAAEALPEPANRPDTVDLPQLWHERSLRFRAGGNQLVVALRIQPERREVLAATALGIGWQEREADGWLRLEAVFQDSRHAEWAMWQLGLGAEVLAPESLRVTLRERALELAARYQASSEATGG